MQTGFSRARERSTEGLGAYEKLVAFRTELQQRTAIKRDHEKNIIDNLNAQEAGLDEAIVNGRGHVVQEVIDRLKAELATTRRELLALENPPKDGHLGDLIKAVWTEATQEITIDLRAEWDAEVIEAEKAKAQFLAAVASLGQIKAKADHISSRTVEIMLGVPGPKLATPYLSTGINERHKTGVIYIDPKEVEKTFNGGR